jgi:hypothetical protein
MPSGIGWYVCRISLKCVETGPKRAGPQGFPLWRTQDVQFYTEVVVLGGRWRCGLLFTLHPLFPQSGQEESSGEVSDDWSYDLKYHGPHKYLWLMAFSCFIQQRWMLHMIPTTFSSLYVANHIFPIIALTLHQKLGAGYSWTFHILWFYN